MPWKVLILLSCLVLQQANDYYAEIEIIGTKLQAFSQVHRADREANSAAS
jgi:hypothetical protein